MRLELSCINTRPAAPRYFLEVEKGPWERGCKPLSACNYVGGGQGAGVRENRGREGYGRRERKGREAGVLRGWAAGEKYETLIFLIQQCVRILSKTRTQNIRANYNAGLD